MTSWQGTQAEEAVLDSITDGFFVLGGDWRFIFLNAQAERWWRAHGEAQPGTNVLLGENAWELFPKAVGGDLYSTLHRTAQEQNTGELELYVPQWERWFSVRIYPFAAGLTVYFTDISKYKRVESDLFQALQEITNETLWFNHALVGKLARAATRRVGSAAKGKVPSSMPTLTKREKQVLNYVALGRDNGYIALDLGLAEQTVRNYITHLYTKLGVHSRTEVVVWARERGLVGAESPVPAGNLSKKRNFSSGR